jgi:hypothetical protein
VTPSYSTAVVGFIAALGRIGDWIGQNKRLLPVPTPRPRKQEKDRDPDKKKAENHLMSTLLGPLEPPVPKNQPARRSGALSAASARRLAGEDSWWKEEEMGDWMCEGASTCDSSVALSLFLASNQSSRKAPNHSQAHDK